MLIKYYQPRTWPHSPTSGLRMNTLRRINKERISLERDPLESCSAAPSRDADVHHWTGSISGPPNTPYQNGTFNITINLPEDYPRTAPRITFTTPIYHPNVSPQGITRLADLELSQWCPAVTIRSLLISLQALLSDPNLLDGCVINEDAAKLSADDRGAYEVKAREWTKAHAVLHEKKKA